jgi:hypothetical protein
MAFGGVSENQGGTNFIQLDVLCGCEVEGFFLFFCFFVFGWSPVEETCKKNSENQALFENNFLKIKHFCQFKN